jgi:predicted permease
MKLWWVWRKRKRELEKEILHHLQMAATEREERGATARDAQAGARREFGNVGLVKEVTRDAWGWRWLENLYEDLRYGFRTLHKQLGFATIAIVTLGLGIGANTAIFSLFNTALLKAIPVRDAEQLVALQWKARKAPAHLGMASYGDCESNFQKTGASGCSLSEPFFRQIESKEDMFSSVAAFGSAERLSLSGSGNASVVNRAEYVTGKYFETLRIKPAMGRLIAGDDDKSSAASVVVLSYRFWRSRFGGSKEVLGRTILLNRVPFTVIGVAEEAFDSLSPGNIFDLWLPLATASRLELPWDGRDIDAAYWRLVVVGRLKAETAVGTANAELSTLFQNETARPVGHGGLPMLKPEDGGSIELRPLERGLTGARRGAAAPLYLMMLVVGIVLLIACANVAGLMLARASSRQREMAVRFALGASKGRILRQLLTESLILSCAGGVLGLFIASWCLAGIVGFLQSNQDGPLPFTPAMDTRVLLYTAIIAILTGVVFGLAPALRGMRVDLTPALKEGAGSSAQHSRAKKGWFTAGNWLVVAQVALSIVVLAGAGLLVRTLQNLKNVNPGFDTQNVLTFSMDPTLIGYKISDADHLYGELRERLVQMPGVQSVSYSWRPLLGGGLWTTSFHLEGTPKDQDSDADVLPVGPEFFHTMRIPLLQGREFNATDFARAQLLANAQERQNAERARNLKSNAGAAANIASEDLPPTPAIVNQTFVRKFLPSVSPLGHVFGAQPADPAKGEDKSAGWEIAGVVGDARYNQLRRDVEPTIYIPSSGGQVSFAIRTATDPSKSIPQIRAMVSQLDSNLPVFEIRTETEQIQRQIFLQRLTARLSGSFGVLALTLACIGLYGLISYEVARRTREIGIRSALGAARRDVLKLVLTQGMRLTLVGTIVGLGLALGLTHFAKSLLYGVKAADPLTYVAVTVLLVGVTLAACYVPARRATRVDPVVALRHE